MRRSVVGLAAVAVVASLSVAMAWRQVGPDPLAGQGPQPALPVLIANYRNADRIELQHGAQRLRLERRGQVWGLSQAGGYPVRPEAAAALIDGLLALRLDHTVDGTAEGLGVADATAPDGAGTLVRVLGVSGAVLGAIILGPADGPPYVRRPGQPAIWQATAHVTASTDPIAWTGGRLPPPQVVTVAPDDAAIQEALVDLRFSDVRASAQIHPAPVRSIGLTLPDGVTVLRVGRWEGRTWLQVAGTASWARQLSPYAFALVADSTLALQ